ncbi:MAG: hypothetical protein ACFB14_09785 [Leptolyngbyaceae cyanobacterium]
MTDGLFGAQDFHPPSCISNYRDRNEIIYGRICGGGEDLGLPDLKDTVPGDNWVLDQRRQYVQTPMVFDDGTTAAPPYGQARDGRWQGVWNRDRMTRMIHFHNRMEGTSMEILHADDCTLL